MKTLLFFLLVLICSHSSAQEWKQLPGPTRSKAKVIEVDKFGNIYAITDSNDIYRSLDSGKSWTKYPLPQGIKPKQGTTLYCSKYGPLYLSVWDNTSSPNPPIDSNTLGLYRSSDKGVTWSQVIKRTLISSLKDNGDRYCFAVQASNNPNSTIYRSIDYGITWSAFKTLNFFSNKYELGPSDQLYVQENNRSPIWIYDKNGNEKDKWADSALMSRDGYPLDGCLSYIGNNRFGFLTDSVFFLRETNGAWINEGKLITNTSTTNYRTFNSSLKVQQGKLVAVIENQYSGEKLVKYSTNYGSTWELWDTIPYNYYGTPITLDSSNNLIYSWKFGIIRTDFGNTKKESLGFPISTVTSIVVDKNGHLHAVDSGQHDITSNMYFVAGTLFFSSDNGMTWTKESFEGGIAGSIGLSGDSGVYGILHNGNYSSNYFTELKHYDPVTMKWSKVRSFEYNVYPKNFSSLSQSVTYLDLERSDDNGNTWESPITQPPISLELLHSFSIPTIGKIICGYRPAIYMTEDNGVSWKKLYHNLTDRSITALYSNTDSLIIAGSEYGDVIRSNNNGTSWADWRGSLQGSIKKITATIDNTIYAATTSGLYSRGLIDADWKVEIPDKEIVSISFGKDNEVFACISQEGIWTDWKKHFPTIKEGVATKGNKVVTVSPSPATNYIS